MNCVLNGMKKMISCGSCKSCMAPGPDFWEKPRSLTWWKAGSHAEVRCLKWKFDKNCLQTMIDSCICWTCFSFGIRCWNIVINWFVACLTATSHPDTSSIPDLLLLSCVRLDALVCVWGHPSCSSFDLDGRGVGGHGCFQRVKSHRGESQKKIRKIWNESGLQMNFKYP